MYGVSEIYPRVKKCLMVRFKKPSGFSDFVLTVVYIYFFSLSMLQNYAGVNVRNFTSSWSDGLAFNALLHRWRPQLFSYSSIVRRSPAARLDHAFALAQAHLGIDRLLDPEGTLLVTDHYWKLLRCL